MAIGISVVVITPQLRVNPLIKLVGSILDLSGKTTWRASIGNKNLSCGNRDINRRDNSTVAT